MLLISSFYSSKKYICNSLFLFCWYQSLLSGFSFLLPQSLESPSAAILFIWYKQTIVMSPSWKLHLPRINIQILLPKFYGLFYLVRNLWFIRLGMNYMSVKLTLSLNWHATSNIQAMAFLFNKTRWNCLMCLPWSLPYWNSRMSVITSLLLVPGILYYLFIIYLCDWF